MLDRKKADIGKFKVKLMNNIGQKERLTQNRVVKLFRDTLGYTYLGNREDRLNNSNIEEGIVREYLSGKGYSL